MPQGGAALGPLAYPLDDCRNNELLQLKVRRCGNRDRGRKALRFRFSRAATAVLVPLGCTRLAPQTMRPWVADRKFCFAGRERSTDARMV